MDGVVDVAALRRAPVVTRRRIVVGLASLFSVTLAGAGLRSYHPRQAHVGGEMTPGNWAASAHEGHVTIRDPLTGDIHLGAAQDSGVFTATRWKPDGTAVERRDFGPSWLTRDDHHSHHTYFPLHPKNPRLVIGQAGHAANFLPGVQHNQLRWQISRSGKFSDLVETVTLLPEGERPNYGQWLEHAPSGRLIKMYNDDTSRSWLPYFSNDHAETWVRGRPIVAADSGQLYMKFDTGAAFQGTLPNGEAAWYVPFYAFPNVKDEGQVFKKGMLDLVSGRCFKPDGSPIGAGASIYDQADEPITTLAANDLETIRAPAKGRSQRLNYAHKGMVYVTDTPDVHSATPFGAGLPIDDARAGRHIVMKNGVEYDVGGCGFPYWTKGYCPEIQPAMEAHDGDRIYRIVNDGKSAESRAKLLRLDWPEGMESGQPPVVTVMLEAGVTPGLPSSSGVYRYFPVWDCAAKKGEVCGFALTGRYENSYRGWVDMQFVPIFAA